MSHAVPNQRFLALDDVSLNAAVVVAPLPEDMHPREHKSLVVAMDGGKHVHARTHSVQCRCVMSKSHHELLRIPFMPP